MTDTTVASQATYIFAACLPICPHLVPGVIVPSDVMHFALNGRLNFMCLSPILPASDAERIGDPRQPVNTTPAGAEQPGAWSYNRPEEDTKRAYLFPCHCHAVDAATRLRPTQAENTERRSNRRAGEPPLLHEMPATAIPVRAEPNRWRFPVGPNVPVARSDASAAPLFVLLCSVHAHAVCPPMPRAHAPHLHCTVPPFLRFRRG